MVKGGNGQWVPNPNWSWNPAPVKPPNAAYQYQRQATPTSQVVDQNIDQGYRYGTDNSPNAQRGQHMAQAQANMDKVNAGNRPQWHGPSAGKNAEYNRMNPIAGQGRANYDQDVSRGNTQRNAANAQMTQMRNQFNQHGGASPSYGQPRPQQAQAQQPQSQQGVGGIASLARNKMAGPTRWS